EGAEIDFGAGPMSPAALFGMMAARRDEADESAPAHQPANRAETYIHDGDLLTVVIAGDGAGEEAEQFAQHAGLPLLAEVVSGARYGREAIATYASLIDDPAVGGLIERAVVFGHPTLTRQVPALLARADVEVIIVDPHSGDGVDHYGAPDRDAQSLAPAVVHSARVAESYDPRRMRRWLGAWVVADRELREALTTVHTP